MTSKVDEVLASIPVLKVDLSDVFDFKDQCFDKMAKEIIGESLDYALTTSVRRLESVAKINPAIAIAARETILPAVKTLRNLVARAPECPTSALESAPLMPAPTKPMRKKEPAKKPEELLKTLGEATKKKKTPLRKPKPTTAEQAVEILEGQKEKKETPPLADMVGKGRVVTLESTTGKTKKTLKFHIVDPLAIKGGMVSETEGATMIGTNDLIAKTLIGKREGETIPVGEYKGKPVMMKIIKVEQGLVAAPETKIE